MPLKSSMAGAGISEIARLFEEQRRLRRGDPLRALADAGRLGALALDLLNSCTREPIEWRHDGPKRYSVFCVRGTRLPFSKAVNDDLFLSRKKDFEAGWKLFLDALGRSLRRRHPVLRGIDSALVDRLFYTAVHSYAAAIDLFARGNRGGPGTFLEMLVGPTVAVLSGRIEQGTIELLIPDTNEIVPVTVDLSYHSDDGAHVLVVPTKISTRERIVQAYTHQLILERIRPGVFHTILCISNENNVMFESGLRLGERTTDHCWLVDTLVPGTIATYQRFVVELEGLYYLDPPERYLLGALGMPRVGRFGQLVTEDLGTLLPR